MKRDLEHLIEIANCDWKSSISSDRISEECYSFSFSCTSDLYLEPLKQLKNMSNLNGFLNEGVDLTRRNANTVTVDVNLCYSN